MRRVTVAALLAGSLLAVPVGVGGTPDVVPAGPVTVGLVDPSQGRWHLRDPLGNVASFFFGNPGDFPFMGDWDCDGVDTPGLYRRSDGFVYLRNSNTQGIADIRFFFGNPRDIPLAGDFNGDGCDTVSLYRPAEARVFIINRLGANEGGLGTADFSYLFGDRDDMPFVGDFNRDGIDTIGLHRPSTGMVLFRNSHTPGMADGRLAFGDPGDRIVAGDWDSDGIDTPALFRPRNATFIFRHSFDLLPPDTELEFGDSDFLPVAGVFALPRPECDAPFPLGLGRIIRDLDPDGDADGDGFTNAQETGPLAFDPRADPAVFNPLVADVPELDFEIVGGIVVQLQRLTEDEETEIDVDIDEDEITVTRIDAATVTTELEREVAQVVDGADILAGFANVADFNFNNATTVEREITLKAQARVLDRDEDIDIDRENEVVDGALLRVLVRVENAGHVQFRLNRIELAVSRRTLAGDLETLGTLTVSRGVEPERLLNDPLPKNLAPGESVLIHLDEAVIDAELAFDLVDDTAALVLEVGDIDVGAIEAASVQIRSVPFDAYSQSIQANTAAVIVDFGPGVEPDRHLVSTTYFRDEFGFPEGSALCDALRTILGKELRISEPTRLLTTRGSGTVRFLAGMNKDRFRSFDLEPGRAFWIVDTGSDSVAGRPLFDLTDITLRRGEAVRLVYVEDRDRDGLTARTEAVLGSSDHDVDSDDDGLTDPGEASVGWTVQVVGKPGYKIVSDPITADGDSDGLTDPIEKSLRTDPFRSDTDGDGVDDGVDPAPRDPGIPPPANGS